MTDKVRFEKVDGMFHKIMTMERSMPISKDMLLKERDSIKARLIEIESDLKQIEGLESQDIKA
jgi:hypothetical protein